MLAQFKLQVSSTDTIKSFIKLFFATGDRVRPIIQKPLVDKFIGDRIYQCALDAGCGRGLYTRTLLKVARKVIAIDYSKNHIDVLRRRLGHLPQLSLQEGSADNLPFGNEQFDLVIHCEVLEHIHNDRKVLSELYRVLQPGGQLVLSVPVPPAPIFDAEHVREGYRLSEISSLLQEAGFEILDHQYCMFNPSKWVIKTQAWWSQRFKLPLPSVILLPVYWERIWKQQLSQDNLPYDIVLRAIRA